MYTRPRTRTAVNPGMISFSNSGLAYNSSIVKRCVCGSQAVGGSSSGLVLLIAHGVPGWFSVPAGLPDAEVEDHEAFRREHSLHYDETEFADRRGVLSWDDVRRLDKNHVICCHGFSHRRLAADLTDEELALEIPMAKAKLECELGHPVSVFVWVGGEEWSYSAGAAEAIRKAGFELGFMTNHARIRPGDDPLQIQRTNVEAWDPPELVHLSLSGFFDLLYWPKRRRVNQLTRGAPSRP